MKEMTKATREFIRLHAQEDVRQLALQGGKNPDVDMRFALEQIAERQKALTKLPSWTAIEGIVYPPHISMEQCSSEPTARYKAKIAGEGDLFVDLTAGFGVDTAFIAKGFKQAVAIELQEHLCTISSQNFKLLGLDHVEVVCGNGLDYLHTLPHASLIFIDPARRDEHGARTYGLADCTPNVLEIIDEMAEKADKVMIKLSPMLDWRKAVNDIGSVSEVHIVSVNNECKELLLLVNSEKRIVNSERIGNREEDLLKVVCVNLLPDGTEEHFEFDHPSPTTYHSSPITYHSSPITYHYLYVPNASIMKAGCFDLIAERYQIGQIDPNSHLFVSDAEVTDFPGRRFIIDKTTTMNKRELKEALTGVTRANIAVRNFPMTVAELRKRLKLQDGGDTYIFATTTANMGHQLFVCRKNS